MALLSGRKPTSPSPNWPEVLRIADKNRVKPLIYDSVRSLCLDVPEEILLPLARAYAATFAKNCEILNALDEMGRILSQHGIDVVPIKGASLIQRVYEDTGLRPLLDIDVWIDGEDARLAKQILQDAGFAKKFKKQNRAIAKRHTTPRSSLLQASERRNRHANRSFAFAYPSGPPATAERKRHHA